MFYYWITVCLFKIFARIFFRFKIEGKENLPPQGGYIIASNHASSLDPFVVMASIPRYVRWLIVYEYYDLWYLRWILSRMRFIRVQKNLPKQAFRALLRGDVIGVFPEARRTWTGKMGPPKEGAVVLARRTGSPVVPLAIKGTFEALPRTKRFPPKPHPIILRIGRPLFFSPQKNTTQQLNQDAQKIMESIAGML